MKKKPIHFVVIVLICVLILTFGSGCGGGCLQCAGAGCQKACTGCAVCTGEGCVSVCNGCADFTEGCANAGD